MTTHFIDDIVAYVGGLKEKKTSSPLSHLPEGIRLETFATAKTVSKPWGFELWLAHGKELPYALKMIHIRKGTKTSLQYHKEKAEHNVIFAGEAKIYYEDPETKKIVSEKLSPGSIVQIKPPAIHRFEALTDIFIVEVSTHHLDDVVRLDDDYKRPDGKIDSEHSPRL